MTRSFDVIHKLQGKTLATAESLTGGGIGASLTAVPGSSAVYKGGVISYTNEVKHHVLGVPDDVLERYGAVSAPVAGFMAGGVRKLLNADIAVSVTGLAGPTGDEYGNPVGTVYIGYEDRQRAVVRHYLFEGDRQTIRNQTIAAALELILQYNP
jgi:nicotinamide-nucleotide amidase